MYHGISHHYLKTCFHCKLLMVLLIYLKSFQLNNLITFRALDISKSSWIYVGSEHTLAEQTLICVEVNNWKKKKITKYNLCIKFHLYWEMIEIERPHITMPNRIFINFTNKYGVHSVVLDLFMIFRIFCFDHNLQQFLIELNFNCAESFSNKSRANSLIFINRYP